MKREVNEDFEAYKIRRKKMKQELKRKLSWRWFWNPGKQGTYIRNK